MKIWFINTQESDYLQDLTYSGLVQILGKACVLDLPLNIKYHLPTRKIYPRNLGYEPRQLWKRLWSHIVRPDLVIVGSCNPKCIQNYLNLKSQIPDSVPVVFIDGGDESDIGGDLRRLKSPLRYEDLAQQRPFDLIFKREKLRNVSYAHNVFALPFSSRMDIYGKMPDVSLKYDVTFWAVQSHPVRTKALEILSGKYDCEANGTVLNQTFKKYKRKGLFYLKELKASKIILNLRGAGWDTLRYWEVPALGAFMMTQKPQIEIPHDFEHGKHVIHFRDDLSDMIEMCDYYLKNETQRQLIAQSAQEHVLKFHSHTARAQYLLDIIRKNLKI